ncbi:hypothetical protein [Vitiosangium sp. GDMCC 1.1324]|uniref:hypothetical protein n=1 Tax=Vitiosangium sp. (strain GDMCC 1.1324) TaxID=2138576 RepID=UPI000D36D9DB|nr:hypothetical protein [Vitiosangium sp. GDMCC 1.1324]PTL79988.1 hypothetical protein DAT35_31705 [Vitiosangium sp. GDMCC 1.1324]
MAKIIGCGVSIAERRPTTPWWRLSLHDDASHGFGRCKKREDDIRPIEGRPPLDRMPQVAGRLVIGRQWVKTLRKGVRRFVGDEVSNESFE